MKLECIKSNSVQELEMLMQNSGERVLPMIMAFSVGVIFIVVSLAFVTDSQPVRPDTTAREDIETEEPVEHINLAIEGLKSKYKIGEPIIFTVRATGFSAGGIACGDGFPPLAEITDDSNEEKRTLNPIRFSRVPLCSEPTEFDREFTFGDKEEIVLERSGSYTVTASYTANSAITSHEDIAIEKKFTVS